MISWKEKSRTTSPSQVCIRDLQCSSNCEKCCRAHCQQDLPALLQLTFGRDRQTWNKILAKQVNSSLWKDLRGIVHNTPRSKTRDSFKECVTFHILSVFRNDAAESQMYYISTCLKKLNRVPIRQFVQHMQQLNHNMLDCCKYKKGNKIKKGLGKGQRGSMPPIKRPPVGLHSFWERLNSLKWLMKGSKRAYRSDSDDSNSSWWDRSSSTWGRTVEKFIWLVVHSLTEILHLVWLKLAIT